MRFDQNEKKHTYKAGLLYLSKKKKKQDLTIFPDFFQVSKNVLRIHDSVRTLFI